MLRSSLDEMSGICSSVNFGLRAIIERLSERALYCLLSPTNFQELDDQIALEMEKRRFLILLRQEHARKKGGVVDGPTFDFVE